MTTKGTANAKLATTTKGSAKKDGYIQTRPHSVTSLSRIRTARESNPGNRNRQATVRRARDTKPVRGAYLNIGQPDLLGMYDKPVHVWSGEDKKFIVGALFTFTILVVGFLAGRFA